MSDSDELFELDSEEDDDIVTQRLRRAGKARRSARKADSAPPETAQVSERGTRAATDDDDADFEIDPPDDDIFMRRRPKARASAPAGSGRWFVVAIIVGVVAGVILGAALLSNDDKSAAKGTGTGAMSEADQQIAAEIQELEAQLAAHPEDYEAHVDLGGVLCDIGYTDEAFEHLATATELAPDRQEAWFLVGMCYEAQDPVDTAQVRLAMAKVVELDPDSDFGQEAQKSLDALGGGSTEPADGESP